MFAQLLVLVILGAPHTYKRKQITASLIFFAIFYAFTTRGIRAFASSFLAQVQSGTFNWPLPFIQTGAFFLLSPDCLLYISLIPHVAGLARFHFNLATVYHQQCNHSSQSDSLSTLITLSHGE
jgi:hypothetical protein